MAIFSFGAQLGKPADALAGVAVQAAELERAVNVHFTIAVIAAHLAVQPHVIEGVDRPRPQPHAGAVRLCQVVVACACALVQDGEGGAVRHESVQVIHAPAGGAGLAPGGVHPLVTGYGQRVVPLGKQFMNGGSQRARMTAGQ